MSDTESDTRLDSISDLSGSGISDDALSNDENESTSSTPLKKDTKRYMHAITIEASIYYEKYLHKTPCYDRECSGWVALMSILNGNPVRCHKQFRMHKEVFFELCALLVNNYDLKPMRSVPVEQQLATFMMIVGVREGNRQLQESFQRSGFTISRSFHNVLRACTKMSLDWVRPFTDPTIIHPYIKDNPRYFPHFKDCIGAIDSIHIKASIRCHLQTPFIGRKGSPTQNVMAACDFDMCFTFVLPGWEGNTHDTRIFYSAIRDSSKNFPMPPRGKYYLVDAGYPNITGLLAPYKGQKYHIPDFRRASLYNNHHEAFNHIHSSLRCTIERTFGVWKKKFEIMDHMPVNIAFEEQITLVSATMAIHNFIRLMDRDDDDFVEAERNTNIQTDDCNEDTSGGEYQQNDETMNTLRDDICASITFERIGIRMR